MIPVFIADIWHRLEGDWIGCISQCNSYMDNVNSDLGWRVRKQKDKNYNHCTSFLVVKYIVIIQTFHINVWSYVHNSLVLWTVSATVSEHTMLLEGTANRPPPGSSGPVTGAEIMRKLSKTHTHSDSALKIKVQHCQHWL